MKFIIPWLKEFEKKPIELMFDLHKDQTLMASRLYHACKVANVKMIDKFPDAQDLDQFFIYDYFLNKKLDGNMHFFSEPPDQKNITYLSECSEKEARIHKNKKSTIQFNPFVCNYLKPFDCRKFYRSNILDKFNGEDLTVPLGSINNFCNKNYDKQKVIILDEPHCWSLNKFKSNEVNYQDTYSYLKAIRICKILEKRGFKIITFFTRNDSDFFLQFIDNKWNIMSNSYSWIPYLDLLKLYAQGVLFFSHYQETHGFSVYDNLQMGNGIVVFEENFNPYTINQFQNGVKLSLRICDIACASLIEEYYNSYSKDFFDNIINDSYENFSCDTYIKRLKEAMGICGIFL
jgi:hypothetical protein